MTYLTDYYSAVQQNGLCRMVFLNLGSSILLLVKHYLRGNAYCGSSLSLSLVFLPHKLTLKSFIC